MRPWTLVTLLFAGLAIASPVESVADDGAIATDGNPKGGPQPGKDDPDRWCKPQYHDCMRHCNGRYRESCEKVHISRRSFWPEIIK
ncbi:hypothetical protein N7474_000173 [Penicillium riverlandense]|uniref:uncharacterized protein n=1 Tax=Penicillium riverlandense TaxID=1903569 RepID=UPI002546C61F|nr:uncharacterized protein N7474_000173 [Penicillium riverlandense]KAJ5831862.1 hypothetical protein N7474_000173 [Penicillium riverlandense]